ncbi:MAG: BrnA antitoxin family protein [Endomicrobiales bacterium]|jgi:predicted DNA binding CopG/RHH family protein
MKKLKPIPKFSNEEEEATFWGKHDSTEYVDWSQAKAMILPNLKPSSRAIPIRFPISLIDRLKMLANKRQVPYQSLIKIFLAERVAKELHKPS